MHFMDNWDPTGGLVQWALLWRWLVLFPVVLLVLGLMRKFGVEEGERREGDTLPGDERPRGQADRSKLKLVAQAYGIKPWLVKVIVLSPVALVLVYLGVIMFPKTSSIYSIAIESIFLGEHHLVEMLTVAFEVLAGVFGLALAWQAKKRGDTLLIVGFYVLFSMLMLWTAGEEVAWGQWILGKQTLPTPSWLQGVNQQGELTLHNIGSQQDVVAQSFRALFGLGGLIGVLLSFWQRFQKVGAPLILLPWFSLITILSFSGELQALFGVIIGRPVILELTGHSEIAELMIGISGFLFIWLNSRMLSSLREASAVGKSGATHLE